MKSIRVPLLFLFFAQLSFFALAFSRRVANVQDGTFASHQLHPAVAEEGLLAALFLAATFLREVHSVNVRPHLQAGFMEKAIACYQACIEYSCYAPSAFPATRRVQTHVTLFESFFMSEAARFGEAGTRLPQSPSQQFSHFSLSNIKALGAFLRGWIRARAAFRSLPWKRRIPRCHHVMNTHVKLTHLVQSTVKSAAWVELETWRDQQFFLPWRCVSP